MIVNVAGARFRIQIESHKAGAHLCNKLLIGILSCSKHSGLRPVQPCRVSGGMGQLMKCSCIERVLVLKRARCRQVDLVLMRGIIRLITAVQQNRNAHTV